MLKKILYSVVIFIVFASCILPLVSCGAKLSGIHTSVDVYENEYVADGDYSNLVLGVNVTNSNDGYDLNACSVKLYFSDAFGATLAEKTVTFTDIHVSSGSRDTFYAVYNLEDGAGVIKGAVYSVSAQPYSMTLKQVEAEVGSFWSVVGIIGAVIGIVFVTGVIWGVFFD